MLSLKPIKCYLRDSHFHAHSSKRYIIVLNRWRLFPFAISILTLIHSLLARIYRYWLGQTIPRAAHHPRSIYVSLLRWLIFLCSAFIGTMYWELIVIAVLYTWTCEVKLNYISPFFDIAQYFKVSWSKWDILSFCITVQYYIDVLYSLFNWQSYFTNTGTIFRC